jgi:hypothetical protein
MREILFREAVIRCLLGETDQEKQARLEDEFCIACRAAKRNTDCSTCSRAVSVMKEEAHG